LLLLLLLMVGEEKTVPPYHLPDIYTISQDLLPSCQRIVNIQLIPSTRPSAHPPRQTTDISRASSQQDVAETTVPSVSSLDCHRRQMQCHPSVAGDA
jgi:hypothetical protein